MEERESIEIEIPLDPAHRRIDLVLRESGIEIEEMLAERLAPVAEKALHELLQSEKYES